MKYKYIRFFILLLAFSGCKSREKSSLYGSEQNKFPTIHISKEEFVAQSVPMDAAGDRVLVKLIEECDRIEKKEDQVEMAKCVAQILTRENLPISVPDLTSEKYSWSYARKKVSAFGNGGMIQLDLSIEDEALKAWQKIAKPLEDPAATIHWFARYGFALRGVKTGIKLFEDAKKADDATITYIVAKLFYNPLSIPSIENTTFVKSQIKNLGVTSFIENFERKNFSGTESKVSPNDAFKNSVTAKQRPWLEFLTKENLTLDPYFDQLATLIPGQLLSTKFVNIEVGNCVDYQPPKNNRNLEPLGLGWSILNFDPEKKTIKLQKNQMLVPSETIEIDFVSGVATNSPAKRGQGILDFPLPIADGGRILAGNQVNFLIANSLLKLDTGEFAKPLVFTNGGKNFFFQEIEHPDKGLFYCSNEDWKCKSLPYPAEVKNLVESGLIHLVETSDGPQLITSVVTRRDGNDKTPTPLFRMFKLDGEKGPLLPPIEIPAQSKFSGFFTFTSSTRNRVYSFPKQFDSTYLEILNGDLRSVDSTVPGKPATVLLNTSGKGVSYFLENVANDTDFYGSTGPLLLKPIAGGLIVIFSTEPQAKTLYAAEIDNQTGKIAGVRAIPLKQALNLGDSRFDAATGFGVARLDNAFCTLQVTLQ